MEEKKQTEWDISKISRDVKSHFFQDMEKGGACKVDLEELQKLKRKLFATQKKESKDSALRNKINKARRVSF